MQCETCESPLPPTATRRRKYCEKCRQTRHALRVARWQQEHPERYREAHRKAARNYERRQRAKQRQEKNA